MNVFDKEIFEQAMDIYGVDMQLNIAVEEFSELTKEICKYKRGSNNISNIIEEMADCYIMLYQLGIMFDIKERDLNIAISNKTLRLIS